MRLLFILILGFGPREEEAQQEDNFIVIFNEPPWTIIQVLRLVSP